ncbi:hypothetical protein, partial [Glutamicibacter creatinolyticus]
MTSHPHQPDALAALGALTSTALTERYSSALLGVFGTPQRVLVR